MKIEFRKKELEILLDHFLRDFNYGVGGTWGDGENWTHPGSERNTAIILIDRMMHALKK